MKTEKKAAHTPGPWALAGYFTVKHQDEILANVQRLDCEKHDAEYASIDDKTDHYAESKANARLIAAAPELLAELKKCVQDYEELNDPRSGKKWSHEGARNALVGMRAAIAKAEGR